VSWNVAAVVAASAHTRAVRTTGFACARRSRFASAPVREEDGNMRIPGRSTEVFRTLVCRTPRAAAMSVVVATFLATLLAPGRAAAAEQLLIKHPGDHPDYRFELEPHALVGFGGPFDRDPGLGVGARGTFSIVQNGFVKSINNSVGVGFGLDFVPSRDARILVPVYMQWNFWLSTHWSVFGEPGLGFANGRRAVHPIFSAGGRYHFTEKIALTMRVGYPALSVGVSFLF
jgi:hypothetical protein